MNTQDPGADLLAALKGDKFRCILADAPWRFKNRTGKIAPEHKRLRHREMLTRMAVESGIETPTADDLIQLDRVRKGKKLPNADWESLGPRAKLKLRPVTGAVPASGVIFRTVLIPALACLAAGPSPSGATPAKRPALSWNPRHTPRPGL